MKKRKITKLLGVSLAVVAGLSLVSCGDKKTTTPGTEEVQKYSVTYNVLGHGTAPAGLTDQTTLPSTLPTLSASGYTFDGWFYDQACTQKANPGDTLTANTVLYAKWTVVPASTFSITYNVNGHGTAPAGLTDQTNLPATLPVLTADDWNFEGWFLDAALTQAAVAGQAISANTTLYAKWTEYSVFQKLMKSENLLIGTDFSEYTSTSKLETWSKTWGTKGIYELENIKSTVTDVPNNYVSFDGEKATLIDTTNHGTHAIVDFGGLQDNGVVEGTIDITTIGVGDKWTLFQLYGTDTAKTSVSEVFGLRTNNGLLQYRIDGASTPTAAETSISTAADQTLKIYYKADLEKNTFTMTINDTAFVTDLNFGLTGLAGFKVVTSDNASKTLSIDNIAAVSTPLSLADYKTKLSTKLDSDLLALGKDTNYTVNGAELDKAVSDGKTSIAAATTNAEAKTAYDEAKANLDAVLNDTEQALVTAKTSALSGLTSYVNSESYTINAESLATAIANGSTAINAATDTEGVNKALADAKAAIDLIKNDTDQIAADKVAAKETVAAYKDASDYTINKTLLDTAIANANTAIDACTTQAQIETAIANAKLAIDAIKNDATELQDSKTAALAEIKAYADAEIAKLDATEDAAMITLINTAVSDAEATINEKTSIALVTEAVTTIKGEIDNIIASSGMTLAQAIEASQTNLETYANAEIEKLNATTDATLIAAINSKVTDGKTAIAQVTTTNADVIKVENEYKAEILKLIDADSLAKAITGAKEDVKDHYDSLVADLENENAIEALATVYNAQIKNIEAITDIDSIKAAVTAANSALDTQKAASLQIELDARENYTTSSLVDKIYSIDFIPLVDTTKDITISSVTTYGEFLTLSTVGKTKLSKNEYLSTSGSTWTFETLADNATLTLNYTSTSKNRLFTIDGGESYEPNVIGKEIVITIATAGTHTIVFDSYEHKIGSITLVDKASEPVEGKVNALDATVQAEVETNTSVASLISNVSLSVVAGSLTNTETITEGYTYELTLNGEVVTSLEKAGEYKLVVKYGNVATKYNSKEFTITVTQAEEEAKPVMIGTTGYDTLGDAIAAAEAGDTITLMDNVEVSSMIEITKNLTITGAYTIKASDSFVGDKVFALATKDVTFTLGTVTVDANNKCRGIVASAGKLVIAGATITNGVGTYIGGVYVTNDASFEMTSGTITGNSNSGTDFQNDGYLEYSSDLWIGANANGTLAAITGGEVGNLFVNANEYSKNNPGGFTLNGGTVTNLYVEYDKTYGATFTFTSGEIENLYISTKTTGTSLKVEAVAETVYTGGIDAEAALGNVAYTTFAEALEAAEADSTITLLSDVTIANTIEITKNLTITSKNDYTIKASDSFEDNMLFLVQTEGVVFTLGDIVVDGNGKARCVYVSYGQLTVAGATITNGKGLLGGAYVGGVNITNSGKFLMTDGDISGNTNGGTDFQNDGYLEYSSDLWIGANATGGLVSITGGKVGNIFVNSNSYSANNPGGFTLDGGTVTNLYVEYDANYGATFTYKSGTITNLYVSTVETGTSIKVDPVEGSIYQGGIYFDEVKFKSVFAGGDGSESNPFIINTTEQFNNLKVLSDVLNKTNRAALETTYSALGLSLEYPYYYYKLGADITLDSYTTDYYIANFIGNIDGDNKTITATKTKEGFIFGEVYNNATFQNIKLNSTNVSMICYYNGQISSTNTDVASLLIKNVEILESSTLNATNNSSFYLAAMPNTVTNLSVNFEDCVHAGTVIGAQYNGAFLGGYLGCGTYSFKNLTFKGSLTAIHAGMLFGNTSNITDVEVADLVIENCVNEGTIIGSTTATIFGSDNVSANIDYCDTLYQNYASELKNNGTISVGTTLSATKDEDGKIIVTDSTTEEITKYTAEVFVYAEMVNSDGEKTGTNLVSIASYEFATLEALNAAGLHNYKAKYYTGDDTTVKVGDIVDGYYVFEDVETNSYGYKDVLSADGSKTELSTYITITSYTADGYNTSIQVK